MQQAQLHGPKISPLAIFLTFSKIALLSFGSPPFWTRRELVERKRWLTDHEFLEFLALGQLLPGPNIINLSVIAGHRFCGWPGAAAAIVGFLVWPFLIVISLGMLHQRFGAIPLVHDAIIGMSAVTVGLLVAAGLKMAMVLPRKWGPWLCCGLAFLGIGVLRWPLVAILGILGPLAIIAAWKGKM